MKKVAVFLAAAIFLMVGLMSSGAAAGWHEPYEDEPTYEERHRLGPAIVIDEKPVEFSSLKDLLDNLVLESKSFENKGRLHFYYEFSLKNVPPAWRIKKAWFKARPWTVETTNWAEAHIYTFGEYREGQRFKARLYPTEESFPKWRLREEKTFQVTEYLPDGTQTTREVKVPISLTAVSSYKVSKTEVENFGKLVKEAIKHYKPLIFEFDFYSIYPKPEKIEDLGWKGITIEFFITNVRNIEE